ncbi:hypothetical protein MPC4_10359 [Methylocella tundrae]|uniref:Uncharacterized protein n=1 Tax=Methylocella tundrae TaxID=227605 RepID=A0A8B6M1R4_METTU|nr:hypothetical protein MPC4_10359 [Methylocella tundrae]
MANYELQFVYAKIAVRERARRHDNAFSSGTASHVRRLHIPETALAR